MVTAPRAPFSAYRPAVVAEFADLRSRQFGAAETADQATVDPAYDALDRALSAGAAVSARQADRSERLAHNGSILVTVLAFNLLGDGIRDLLDPRLRGSV